MCKPFWTGLNNNMDYMRISGTEPSSVIQIFKLFRREYF